MISKESENNFITKLYTVDNRDESHKTQARGSRLFEGLSGWIHPATAPKRLSLCPGREDAEKSLRKLNRYRNIYILI